jgi:hypothetical protein
MITTTLRWMNLSCLLLEMRESNRVFHDNGKSIEQAKALLNDQFPDDLQK